jgi:hypothetical protein
LLPLTDAATPFFGAPQFGHRSGRRDHTRQRGHCVCARSSEMRGGLAIAIAEVIRPPEAIVSQAAEKYNTNTK